MHARGFLDNNARCRLLPDPAQDMVCCQLIQIHLRMALTGLIFQHDISRAEAACRNIRSKRPRGSNKLVQCQEILCCGIVMRHVILRVRYNKASTVQHSDRLALTVSSALLLTWALNHKIIALWLSVNTPPHRAQERFKYENFMVLLLKYQALAYHFMFLALALGLYSVSFIFLLSLKIIGQLNVTSRG